MCLTSKHVSMKATCKWRDRQSSFSTN